MTKALALVLSLAFGSISAPALAGPIYYRAQPVAVPAEPRLIAGDSLWRCGSNECVARASHSRPARVCGALVRAIGPLRSFSAGGRPLSAAELGKCNGSAR